jgi:EAL domain-containing protein (putative c-di-GMP-specific phosphodiesterase class I)
LRDSGLVEVLRAELDREGVEPKLLVIEMRELDLASDIDAARAFIASLRALGCEFCVDAFGSGAWSFGCLRHLSLDGVKIDGALVRGSGSQPQEAYLLQAIIGLCRELGIRVVVDHIQDADTLQKVRENGFEYAQGFYLAEPAPIDTFMPAENGAEPTASDLRFRLGFAEG